MKVIVKIAVLVCCFLGTINSQDRVFGETVFNCEASPGAIEETISWPYDHTINSAIVRIYVHKVYRPDGSGGPSQELVDNALSDMYEEYHKFGISFKLSGQDEIFAPSNEDYDWPTKSPGWNHGFRFENPHPDAVDVYIFGTDTLINPGGNSYLWTSGETHAIGIWGVWIENKSLVHEMGHSLNLRHTFEGSPCLDWPPNPDCENCGDQVCDTPPDLQSIAEECWDFDNCELLPCYYEDYVPFGFDVDTNNFMSYYFVCLSGFSQGQIDRMFASIENDLFDLQDVIEQPRVVYEAPANSEVETGLTYLGTPYSSVVWNFNDDAFKDLFIAISDATSALFEGEFVRPSGYPYFQEVGANRFDGGAPQMGLKGVSVADVDNQGSAELFAAHATDSRLYQWDPSTGDILNLGGSSGITALSSYATAGSWGDFDNDGYLDLYVSVAENYIEDPLSYTAPKLVPASRLLKNDFLASGIVQFVTLGNSLLPNNIYSINSSWGHIDSGDGDYPDLFVGSPLHLGAGGSKLFRNNEDGTFTEVTDVLQAGPILMNTGSAWADMNNDQNLDLVLSFHNSQPAIFFNNGAGGFDDGSGGGGPFRFGPDHGFSGLVIFNFNNSPRRDLLGLSNSYSRSLVLFENHEAPNGSLAFLERQVDVGLDDLGYAHGAVAADFGGPGSVPDGVADLYIGRPKNTNKFFFRGVENSGSPSGANHFVTVRLTSVASQDNKHGVGAKVVLDYGGYSAVQFVDGGSMRGGQADPDLLFGLGEYDGPLGATIYWPSGIVQPDVPLVIDQVNVLTNSAVEVIDTTVEARYILRQNGLVDWEFSWETDSPGDPSLDKVIFNMGAIPVQCQPELGNIQGGVDPDVSLAYSVSPSGGYSHVMTWRNRPCVPKCTILYSVESGLGSQFDQSQEEQLRVRICAGF